MRLATTLDDGRSAVPRVGHVRVRPRRICARWWPLALHRGTDIPRRLLRRAQPLRLLSVAAGAAAALPALTSAAAAAAAATAATLACAAAESSAAAAAASAAAQSAPLTSGPAAS